MRHVSTQSIPARRGPKPNPATRDNLLRAGMDMLHGSGYSATGIKEIVDAANVPKGSFYNHFESKEVFGREIVDHYFLTNLPALQAHFTDQSVPPLERLRSYFEDRIRSFEAGGYVRGCLMGNLSLEVADHSEVIRDQLAEHFQTWSALIEQCVLSAQELGMMSGRLPAVLLAQFLLNSWEGALLRMRVERTDAPLREFMTVVFDSLLV